MNSQIVKFSVARVVFITFYYWEVLVTEKMYAGLFVVMMLGVLLTFGLQWIERKIMPWEE